jgi:excisionase family DNA binding protein
MYNLTRQDAAEKLGISTRSIDRYIKAGKIRAKKDGKVVYVNDSDIDTLLSGGSVRQEVIYEKKNV